MAPPSRHRIAAARRLFPLFTACVLTVFLLTGCLPPPDPAQLERDLAPVHPGCRVVQHHAGEGDSDHVYIDARLQCEGPPHRRVAEFGYRRDSGRWQVFHVHAEAAPEGAATSRQ